MGVGIDALNKVLEPELEELSDDVSTNIDGMIMYSIKGVNPERDQDVRVLKMSHFYLPDTEKRRK